MTDILEKWRDESRSQDILTPAELAAMHEADRPLVSKGCICPKLKEEIDGVMYKVICPACEIHGTHSRYVPRPGVSTREMRRDAHRHSEHTISER